MRQANPEADSMLKDAYEQQSRLYERAISIAQRLDNESPSLAEANPHLLELRATLAEIEKTEPVVQEARTKVMDQPRSAELEDVTKKLCTHIEQLLTLVNAAELRFRHARERLLPNVGVEITARRMVDAYKGGPRS